jgi:hypothetical protein
VRLSFSPDRYPNDPGNPVVKAGMPAWLTFPASSCRESRSLRFEHYRIRSHFPQQVPGQHAHSRIRNTLKIPRTGYCYAPASMISIIRRAKLISGRAGDETVKY